jgi:hypothetical protein
MNTQIQINLNKKLDESASYDLVLFPELDQIGEILWRMS